MCKKAKMKLGLWMACLLIGVSVLFGQWVMAGSAPVVMEEVVAATPAPRPAVDPIAVRPIQNLVKPVEAPMPVVEAVLDTRLVARLLVDSVTQVESLGNPRMVGRHGERGLMQIKAGAWGDVTRRLFGRRISFDRAFEGKLNQQVGAGYLSDLQVFLARHQRLWKADERSLLLACYNAGPERVKRAGFDLRRLPAHTQDYVKRASALHDALLADHQVDPARVRLALAEQRATSSGS
jgi:soluble lytic murein transglycosylase-like protein